LFLPILSYLSYNFQRTENTNGVIILKVIGFVKPFYRRVVSVFPFYPYQLAT